MLAPLLTLSCVFPAGSSTGLEFSWRFAESAGEMRARTCDGALVTHVELRVTDTEDASRTETRRYACESGYAGPGVQSPPLSDAFFDVRPGTYAVEYLALHDPGVVKDDGDGDDDTDDTDSAPTIVAEAQGEVVLEQGIVLTAQRFPLETEPVVLHLLAPPGACGEARVWLRYENPQRDLEDPEDDLLYNEALEGHHGLRFNGEPAPCWTLPGNDLDLDRGAYRLDISLDGGEVCTVPFVVDGSQAAYFMDLSLLC